jgi:hypothetical protein
MYYDVLRMRLEHPFHVETDGWARANELLDGGEEEPVLGLLSMDDGVIVNGKENAVTDQDFYLGPAEKVDGSYLVLPPGLSHRLYSTQPSLMESEERNSAGFFIGHSDGQPVEVKYDEDIPDSEEWHAHAGFEAYAPRGGSIELGMAQDYSFRDVSYEKVSEGEVMVVSPFVQHKVVDQTDDPDLAVVRYSDESERIPKYDSEGDLVYSWGGETPEYSFEPGNPGETVKRI